MGRILFQFFDDAESIAQAVTAYLASDDRTANAPADARTGYVLAELVADALEVLASVADRGRAEVAPDMRTGYVPTEAA